jgi:heme-degrading monooxygenase HmoA
MHARVSTYQGQPNLSDDQISAIVQTQQDTILPKIRSMDGYKGVLSLIDNATGKAMSVTLWDSADAMAASEADASRVREESAEVADEQITGVERFAVAVFEVT